MCPEISEIPPPVASRFASLTKVNEFFLKKDSVEKVKPNCFKEFLEIDGLKSQYLKRCAELDGLQIKMDKIIQDFPAPYFTWSCPDTVDNVTIQPIRHAISTRMQKLYGLLQAEIGNPIDRLETLSENNATPIEELQAMKNKIESALKENKPEHEMRMKALTEDSDLWKGLIERDFLIHQYNSNMLKKLENLMATTYFLGGATFGGEEETHNLVPTVTMAKLKVIYDQLIENLEYHHGESPHASAENKSDWARLIENKLDEFGSVLADCLDNRQLEKKILAPAERSIISAKVETDMWTAKNLADAGRVCTNLYKDLLSDHLTAVRTMLVIRDKSSSEKLDALMQFLEVAKTLRLNATKLYKKRLELERKAEQEHIAQRSRERIDATTSIPFYPATGSPALA